jgi:hypothetical protein
MATPRKRVNTRSTLSSRRRAQAKVKNSKAEVVGNDIRNRINLGARQAAAEIMNRLAEKGPVYSGSFRDSWIAIPIGGGASGRAGGEYPYQTIDVPKLSLTIKEVRRAKVYTITNTSPYAEIALDLEEGDFIRPEYDPEGGIEFGVLEGRRYGRIRGQVRAFTEDEESQREEDAIAGDPPRRANVSTAPLDWYTTFMRSGEVDKEIRRAFEFAFQVNSKSPMTYEEYRAARETQ